MTSRRISARLDHLEPRAEELTTRITQEQGRQLAEVIRRSLEAHRDRTLDVLGDSPEADTIRRLWPRWTEEIVPEQIEAVTGGGEPR